MEKSKATSTKVTVENGFLIIERNGNSFRFELRNLSDRLSKATEEQLSHFTVSPSGYGIHWNLIDEDISIPSLLNEPVEPYGKSK